MLFEERSWSLIADGSVTVTFRRWKRPQVLAGRPYRTPGGIVEVLSVRAIDPAKITKADARRAGYADPDAVRAALRGEPTDAVLRIEFRLAAGARPGQSPRRRSRPAHCSPLPPTSVRRSPT